jgi:hypothetical protein
MFSASTTSPPIVNTSLHALAAAIAPSSAGPSTTGGTKSVVDTSATPLAMTTTAGSSDCDSPINRSLASSPIAASSSPSTVAPTSPRGPARPELGEPDRFSTVIHPPPSAVVGDPAGVANYRHAGWRRAKKCDAMTPKTDNSQDGVVASHVGER